MSKFYTPIAVDLDAVCKALPAGSFLERVRWNPETSCVEVHWEHNQFLTGRDFATEFGEADLQGHRLPKGTAARAKSEIRNPKSENGGPHVGTLRRKTVPVRKAAAVKVSG